MQYKINQAIIVRYLAIDNEEGLTDLILIPTNPSGVDQTPITFTEIGDGLYTVTFTPNALGWWLVRVTSVSKPRNVYSKSYFVGTEFTTYPPQEDGKLTSIDTKLGEVQASPTTNTLLARLKDIWDKLVSLFNDGLAKVKLWDGTNTAGIDTANALYVSGKNAVGATPASNPVYVSGIDALGKKRGLLTDPSGQLYVITGQVAGNLPIQIKFQANHSAVNSNEWQEVLNYTIPANYEFDASTFEGHSQFANEAIRVIQETLGGSFNCATNTFTDNSSILAPQFGTGMYIHVTTAIGSGVNDIFTITYINQDSIAGRTATVTIPKSSLVDTRIEVVLQSGDYGVRDITNVTHSATGQAGVADIEIYQGLFYLLMPTANAHYQAIAVTSGAAIVPEGGEIILQYLAGTKTTYIRRININGMLIPR